MVATATTALATKFPDNIKSYVKKDIPKADFRFDGLITMPDGTMYLPLFPALVKKPDSITIVKTFPENKKLTDLPDIAIFNNDFVLMKILTNTKGQKTVLFQKEPPLEVRTGLLPQEMLVPKGLVLPDNIKGIIGNLEIATAQDPGLRVKSDPLLSYRATTLKVGKNLINVVPQLKNKTMYVATCYSKNIQVINGESRIPEYALTQKMLPISLAATPDGKFLLVTTFSKTSVDVISLVDERIIKQIDLTTQAEEIVIDRITNKAYVSSSADSSIYIIDLNSMTLKQKIKVKGTCEKLSLSDDGKKMFYTDRKNNDIWAIELDNGFVIKNIGKFPNVSKIAFTQNKIYIASRTKNRLAIFDYATMSLIKEMDVEPKPIDMLVYKNNLFVLSAQNNAIQVINTETDEITNTILLNTQGFSTRIYQIPGTDVALVTDTKAGKYSVLDLDKKLVLKTNFLEVPVSIIVVTNRVKKIGK